MEKLKNQSIIIEQNMHMQATTYYNIKFRRMHMGQYLWVYGTIYRRRSIVWL